jgi:hypothetical protein
VRLLDLFQEKAQEFNELTLYDMLMIKSTLDVIYNPAFNCSICVKKTDENYRERQKGCTGKFPKIRTVFPGVSYTRCPGNFYSPSHAMLLDVHRLHRKGVMANEGGLLDQPSKYIDVMNFLETLVTEKETEQLKKSMKNGRKQSRS